ncbi:MAG: DUF433 domain-containing protein [Chloroherpetonaceae bacterium]|nr:DUF433 domain-containing protein [Chloroherpetonaceae bacterium]
MRKILGKYIESDSEKGNGELRFIGTRIAVADALFYVSKGKTFQSISEKYNSLIPPEAVAEAVELAIKSIRDVHTRREYRTRRAKKTSAV